MGRKYYVESDFATGLVNHLGEPVSRFGSAEPCTGGVKRVFRSVFDAATTRPIKEITINVTNNIQVNNYGPGSSEAKKIEGER